VTASFSLAGLGRAPHGAWSSRGFDHFRGMIAAGAFDSGDQVVVGMWRDSPLGRFVDVMWVRPDGERVLLAPDPAVAAFVGELYRFDRVAVTAVRGGWDGWGVEVHAGPLLVQLVPGRRDWRSWVFASRPRPLRRSPVWLELEDRLVGLLGGPLIGGAEGVRVTGTTPSGREESYSIDDYRRMATGALLIDGRDAGALTSLRPDLGVGLSAFPTAPAMVNLVTLIEPPPADNGSTSTAPAAGALRDLRR
jgi:hypothetical protein